MLNPIPIQYLALLAYFILRFGIGIILLHLALTCWGERKALAASVKQSWQVIALPSVLLLCGGKAIIGTMMLFGFYTQYAALALMLMCIDLIFSRSIFHSPLLPNKIFYVLLFFASASLFITGAGAFAVDLPI